MISKKLVTQGPHTTPETVAYSVRGYSMGAIRDGWLVFVHDRRQKPTEALQDELCVVCTTSGRLLVRFMKIGRKPGTWDLLSVTGEPMMDVEVEWADLVEYIQPHKMTPDEVKALQGPTGWEETVE